MADEKARMDRLGHFEKLRRALGKEGKYSYRTIWTRRDSEQRDADLLEASKRLVDEQITQGDPRRPRLIYVEKLSDGGYELRSYIPFKEV